MQELKLKIGEIDFSFKYLNETWSASCEYKNIYYESDDVSFMPLKTAEFKQIDALFIQLVPELEITYDAITVSWYDTIHNHNIIATLKRGFDPRTRQIFKTIRLENKIKELESKTQKQKIMRNLRN